MKRDWFDILSIFLATAFVAVMLVMAVRATLNEIHQHIDRVESRILQLEKDVEALEEREALRGIKCGGVDPDEEKAER